MSIVRLQLMSAWLAQMLISLSILLQVVVALQSILGFPALQLQINKKGTLSPSQWQAKLRARW